MPNTVTYLGYSRTHSGAQSFTGKYRIAFSGSYVQGSNNGESVSLLTAANVNGAELNGAVPMGTGAEVDVVSQNLGGYTAQITNYSAGTFQVNLYGSGGTELASGAYPTAITGGSVTVAVPHRL